MQATLVVVADITREGAAEDSVTGKRGAARQFGLERVKERFRARVVTRTTHTRALSQAAPRDKGTEGSAHVFGPAIAVEDEAPRRPPAMERTGEDATGFARGAAATERPGEHASRVMIQHHGEIAPPVGEAQIRDVADPHPIDARDPRLPHAIGMLREARANARFGAVAAYRLRAESCGAHEACDAATTTAPARVHQLAIQPRAAVAFVMERKEPMNLGAQAPVLERVRAVVAVSPRVEPRARDAIAATERRDVKAFVLGDEVVDEGEDLGFRALQNRMAFFKRSCSSLSSAYLRSSVCSRAISRAGPGGRAFRGWPRSRPSFTSFRHFESMKG